MLKLHPQLWHPLVEWCQSQAVKNAPKLTWECSTKSPAAVKDILRGLLAAHPGVYFEVQTSGSRERVFLVEAADLCDAMEVSVSEKRDLKLWNVTTGDAIHMDFTGWAEDASEIFVAGTGKFAIVVQTLHDQIGAGHLRA